MTKKHRRPQPTGLGHHHRGFAAKLVFLVVLAFAQTIDLRLVQGINFVPVGGLLSQEPPIEGEVWGLFLTHRLRQLALQFAKQAALDDFHLPQGPVRQFAVRWVSDVLFLHRRIYHHFFFLGLVPVQLRADFENALHARFADALAEVNQVARIARRLPLKLAHAAEVLPVGIMHLGGQVFGFVPF